MKQYSELFVIKNIQKPYHISLSSQGDNILLITLFDHLNYYKKILNKWELISEQVKLLDKWKIRVFQHHSNESRFAVLYQESDCYQIQYFIFSQRLSIWVIQQKIRLVPFTQVITYPKTFFTIPLLDAWYTSCTLNLLECEDSSQFFLFSSTKNVKRLKKYSIPGNKFAYNCNTKTIAGQVKNKIVLYPYNNVIVKSTFNVRQKIYGFCFNSDDQLLIHVSQGLMLVSITKKQLIKKIDIPLELPKLESSRVYLLRGVIVLQICESITYLLCLDKEKNISSVIRQNYAFAPFLHSQDRNIYLIEEQYKNCSNSFSYKIFGITDIS